MAVNIITGTNGVISRSTVNASSVFAVGEISIAYDLSNLATWVPGRPINGFTQFITGHAYYVVALQNMDREAQFAPPLILPTSTTTTTTVSTSSTSSTSTSTTSTTQAPSSNGFHYATSTDVAAFPQMRIGDYVLDGANSGPDIQVRASFGNNPTLGPGQRIWVHGGNYFNLYIDTSACVGANGNPIIISPYAGQVRWMNYGTLVGGIWLRFTGKYDNALGIGLPFFRGHDTGYAFTRDKYGFRWDNQWTNTGDSAPSGLSLQGGCQHVEIDYCEFGDGGFTSVFFNDFNGNLDYVDIRIHDNYIHDTGGEGTYEGNTGSDPQRLVKGLRFYNNRICRTGNDGIQFNQLADDCQVYNNTVALAGMNWRDNFEQFQDNGMQIGIRKGGLSFRNNVILGGGEKGINFFYNPSNVAPADGTGVSVDNNVFFASRGEIGGYLGQNSILANTPLSITNNFFGKYVFDYNLVYTDYRATFTQEIIRNAIGNNTITLSGNQYDSTRNTLFNNGSNSTLVDDGTNVQTTLSDLSFENFMGFGTSFAYGKVEQWAPIVGEVWDLDGTSIKGQPIVYDTTRWVMRHSRLYKCKVQNSGIEPGNTSGWQTFWGEVWFNTTTGGQVIDPVDTTGLSMYPPDDVRLTVDNVYNHRKIGLLDNVVFTGTSSTSSTTSTSTGSTTSTTTTVSGQSLNLFAIDNGDNSFTLIYEKLQSWLLSGIGNGDSAVVGAIGSSSMFGTGQTSPNTLPEQLQAYLNTNTTNAQLLNVAQAGVTSVAFMPDGTGGTLPDRNIDAICALRPQALFIYLPSNDIAQGGTAAGMVSNILTMYNKAWSYGIPTWVISPTPRTSLSSQQKTELFNALILERSTFPAQYFIDIYDNFNDGNNNLKPTYDSGDGTHYNNAGATYVTGLMTQALNNYFQDPIWSLYEVWRSSDNINFTLYDTINGATNVKKTYARADANTHYYKVRAKSVGGVYTSYSNVITLTQPIQVGAVDLTVQMDMSVDPAAGGVKTHVTGWNNLEVASVWPAQTLSWNNLIDSTEAPTGVNLVMVNNFAGAGGGGGLWNQYPATVTSDTWFGSLSANPQPSFNITGLNTQKVYNIDIIVSRATTDIRRFSSFKCGTIGDGARASVSSDTPNTSRIVTLRGLIPDNTGKLSISVRSLANTSYINALILRQYANSGATTTTTSTSTTSTSSTTSTTTSGGPTSTTSTTTATPGGRQVFVAMNLGGATAYSNSQWNNWTFLSGETDNNTINLNYTDGSSSGISALFQISSTISDNGSGYGGTIFPAEVMRYVSRYTGSRNLVLSGLNTAKLYTIELVGSRSGSANTDLFTVNSVQQTLNVNNNLTQSVIYTNIAPDVSGNITINLTRDATSTFNYLNGFKITENSSGTTTSTTTGSTTSTTTGSTTSTTTGSTTSTTTGSTTSTTTTAGGASAYVVSSTAYTASQYMKIYTPAGYNNGNTNNYPMYVFLHGTGERGTGNAAAGAPNITTVDNTGLAQLLAAGQNHDFIVIVPQLPTSQNGWTIAHIDAAITYAKANLRVDNNRVYMGGLSLGASGTYTYIATKGPGLIAYADCASEASFAPYTPFQNQPITFWHGTADTTLGSSNSTNAFEGINALTTKSIPSPWIHLFYQVTHSATLWNTNVFDISTAKWRFDLRALLHNLDMPTQATNYVVQAETTNDIHDYYRALRQVNAMSAGSPQTALLARLATVLSTWQVHQPKRFVVNLGGTAAGNVNSVTSGEAGTAITTMVDDTGTTSAYGFTVVTKAITWTAPITLGTGLNNRYFGMDADVWQDSFRTYQNGGQMKFTGLNNSKTYRIRFYAGWLDSSNTEQAGISVIIGTTVKYISSQYNMIGYIEFDSLTPTSGEINFTWAALPTITGSPTYDATSGANSVTTSQISSYNATNGWMPAVVLFEKA